MLRQTVTENGVIHGVACGDPRITVYKGVPYALPPVGQRRWKAPQPMTNWSGVRMADTFADMSLQGQPGLDWSNFYTKELNPTASEYHMSEDCLYLNIWTPSIDGTEQLPVLFYIHGGGYVAGYSYEMEFDGERVARKGCVMVSVGYRLGAMGFFAHDELAQEAPGEAQGNYGFLDQLAAIKWVKRNIEHFGGDGNNITIAGQSAGAGAVTSLMCSPMIEGLISGAIVMSAGGIKGGCSQGRTIEEATAEGKYLLDLLQINTVAQARRLPAEVITKAALENIYIRKPSGQAMRPEPCVDGVFLKETPGAVILGNKLPDIAYMVGYTQGEGYSTFKWRQHRPESMKDFMDHVRKEYGCHAERFLELANVQSDADVTKLYDLPDFHPFILELGGMAQVLAQQGRPVYWYIFDHDIPGEDQVGSFHGSDLWFVFDSLNRCWRPFTGKHYDLARQVSRYFVNFADKGDPNGSDHDGKPLPLWRKYKVDDGAIMRFADTPETITLDRNELMRLRQDKFLGRLDI